MTSAARANGISPYSDHDLLIALTVKVDSFISRQDDHEMRLRLVEKDLESEIGKRQANRHYFNALTVGLLVVAGLLEPAVTLFIGLHK